MTGPLVVGVTSALGKDQGQDGPVSLDGEGQAVVAVGRHQAEEEGCRCQDGPVSLDGEGQVAVGRHQAEEEGCRCRGRGAAKSPVSGW